LADERAIYKDPDISQPTKLNELGLRCVGYERGAQPSERGRMGDELKLAVEVHEAEATGDDRSPSIFSWSVGEDGGFAGLSRRLWTELPVAGDAGIMCSRVRRRFRREALNSVWCDRKIDEYGGPAQLDTTFDGRTFEIADCEDRQWPIVYVDVYAAPADYQLKVVQLSRMGAWVWYCG